MFFFQNPETNGLKRLLAVKKSLAEFEQNVEHVMKVGSFEQPFVGDHIWLSCYYWFTLEPNWERQITWTLGSFQGGNEYDWKCQNVRSFETSLGTMRTCWASTSPTLTGKRASRSKFGRNCRNIYIFCSFSVTSSPNRRRWNCSLGHILRIWTKSRPRSRSSSTWSRTRTSSSQRTSTASATRSSRWAFSSRWKDLYLYLVVMMFVCLFVWKDHQEEPLHQGGRICICI